MEGCQCPAPSSLGLGLRSSGHWAVALTLPLRSAARYLAVSVETLWVGLRGTDNGVFLLRSEDGFSFCFLEIVIKESLVL